MSGMRPQKAGSLRHAAKLTRQVCALLVWIPIAAGCAWDPGGAREAPLRIVGPALEEPLTEHLPGLAHPRDPVDIAVFERINRDRRVAGLPAVEWDEAASRVAETFCAQQVRERTHGHFLVDGLPPYARTALAGVFGMQSENALSWTTTAPQLGESPVKLALRGHEQMMAEKPPHDGHRRTILDPEATHVGVGHAAGSGRFQLAQEFLTRRLELLRLTRSAGLIPSVRIAGRTVVPERLRFVTISVEPPPRPLTREDANGRTSYRYPEPSFAFVPEGRRDAEIAGVWTRDEIRVRRGREFSFRLVTDSPGLWTVLFYTSRTPGGAATPGGLAVLWVERDSMPADR
jgi:hypothetical protein